MGSDFIETIWGTLKFQNLSHTTSDPSIATKLSIGFDICSSREATFPSGKRGLIPTDLILIPLPWYYIRLAKESCLAWMDVLAGIIDPDLRGDIKVLLQNRGKIPFEVHLGDKIAQGSLERAVFPYFIESEPEQTGRGTLGFGEADEPSTTETKMQEEPTILPDLAFAQHSQRLSYR